jgi:ribosomal protein S18 acetylase RimI-like enzyme
MPDWRSQDHAGSGHLTHMTRLPDRAGVQPPVIRRARRDEARDLAGLHLRSALAGFAHIFPSEAPVPDLSALVDHWTKVVGADAPTTRRCFVAVVQDHRIAGTVIAGPAAGDAGCGHLSRLYVDPADWGRGVGRLLYDTAITHLHTSGFRTATLSVLEGNLRARAWYERLGWQATTERIQVYEPADIADVVYTINL